MEAGGLVSENALVPSGMPEAHHGKGAAFSYGALCTMLMAIPLTAINNNSLLDMRGLSHKDFS